MCGWCYKGWYKTAPYGKDVKDAQDAEPFLDIFFTYQESAVGARDDGGDSTSLSPASRVLAIADQLAEEELRDKTGGDNGGSSGIYSTSEGGRLLYYCT